MNKKVTFFVNRMLPISQTFVVEQGKGINRFDVSYLGLRKVKSGISMERYKNNVFYNDTIYGKIRSSLLLFSRYKKEIQRQLSKVDIVHAHFGVNGSIIQPFCQKTKTPLITTFHGYEITTETNYVKWRDLAHKLYTFREDELMEKGDKFIAVSDFLRRKALERGYKSDKVITHYTGINVKAYQKHSNINLEEKQRIIFVGRLVEKKGIFHLLDAFEVIKRKFPKAKIVIIGDGYLKNKVLKRLNSLGSQNASYMGALNHSEVLKEVNKSSILCVPSKTAPNGDSETFGMVFAEAMALGKPVVSFAHGGIPEVVEHGKTGFLAPENDTNSLCNYLMMLLSDEELANSFGKNGLERVKKEFDINKQSRKLENIYDSLI